MPDSVFSSTPPNYPEPVFGRSCNIEFTGSYFRSVIYFVDTRAQRTVNNTITYNSLTGKGSTSQINIYEHRRISSGNLISREDISNSYAISEFKGFSVGAPYYVYVSRAQNVDFFIISGQEQNIYAYMRNVRTTIINPGGDVNKVDVLIHTYSITGGTCDGNTLTPTPAPTPTPKIYLGTAAPPPPPPKKKMDCCDCNTISTIIEAQFINQLKPLSENLKDHIDLRTKEEIQIHKKQLEALEVDLQPIIDRINQAESNLWNGIDIKK